MDMVFHIFRLCAGIGMFLFAMYLLEKSLKNLSGRNFKIFLQRITKSKAGAAAGGAIVTAVLQSSSMVSFMVISFTGAGIFSLKNAMAIILGANLGTTLDSWFVATLGFNTNIEVVAYPAIFAGGLLLIIFQNHKVIQHTSYFLLGFGLLFTGLSFMKTAIEAETFDFSAYARMPLIIFLFAGFLITLMVQSSSVTMALTLTILHAGTIDFPAAAALVLGSETGTTIKILLGAIGGNATKKRLVLGNFLFNIFLTAFAFVLLRPILSLIADIFRISNPVLALVSFSTLVNLLALIVFLPLLNPFTRMLEKFFRDTNASAAAFIGNATVKDPETALELFRKETAWFIHNSMHFNLSLLEIDTASLEEIPEFREINQKRKLFSKSPEEKYNFLKQLQGELQTFYLALRSQLHGEENAQLSQLVSAVRNSIYSAKSMKDIGSNISNLRRSSQDVKFGLFIHHQKETEDLYHRLVLLIREEKKIKPEKLHEIFLDVQETYNSALDNFYREAQHKPVDDLDMTTAINFNRELFTSHKAMLIAVKDFLLEEKEAAYFDEMFNGKLKNKQVALF